MVTSQHHGGDRHMPGSTLQDSSARFATLSIDLELNSGTEAEDQDQDSDDESDIEE